MTAHVGEAVERKVRRGQRRQKGKKESGLYVG